MRATTTIQVYYQSILSGDYVAATWASPALQLPQESLRKTAVLNCFFRLLSRDRATER